VEWCGTAGVHSYSGMEDFPMPIHLLLVEWCGTAGVHSYSGMEDFPMPMPQLLVVGVFPYLDVLIVNKLSIDF
jgi:hypothetical protein